MAKSVISGNPEGILIGSSSKPWRIGKMLGKGACGSVHEISRVPPSQPGATKTSCTSSDFVIKIAPYIKANTTKGKKRKKTAIERNADLLLHENTLYKNVFNKLRGRLIPDVPIHGSPSLIPPGFGEIDGYRYMVMERMSAPLFDVVSSLLEISRKNGKPVSLGEVATAMLQCIKEIHEHRYLFIDVKPENFMLAATNKKNCAQKSPMELAKRVRILDFGLVESFHDMSVCRHRENNYPNSQFVGTPLYASLNVLQGHTPSRRDDLEALLYIISEMVLMIIEKRTNEVLPWSNCQSDDEILNIKRNEIDDSSGESNFFRRVRADGNEAAGKVIKEAFQFVRILKYNEKPKYEQLERLLTGLSVHPRVGKQTTRKKIESKNSKRQQGKDKKSATTALNNISENIQILTKKSKSKVSEKSGAKSPVPDKAPRRSRRIANAINVEENISNVVIIDSESDADDNSISSIDSNTRKRCKTLTKTSNTSFQFKFISGPHKGESFFLEDTVVLGRDPKLVTKTRERRIHDKKTYYDIMKDMEASATHVSLALNSTNRGVTNSVRVTDLNSTNGTFVNGKEIPPGSHRQAFSGDIIQIGTSVVKLKKISTK